MNRRLLALGALVLLVALSGCSVFGGGGEIDEDELTADAEYDWETNATATYTISESALLSLSSDNYQAVIAVHNNSSVDVHRERTFRGDDAVSIRSLQFRFTNGTVVNATHDNLTAIEKSDHTEIQLPAENGSVGYTANWGGGSWGGYGRSWSTPTVVDGSHAVTLPDGGRVGIPFLSRVTPSEDETTVADNRMTIYWEEPDAGRIAVRYYLVRDVYILGTLIVIVTAIGVAGTVYYYRQIQRAKRMRKEVGFDIQDDDDFGRDGPPPGMG